MALTNRSTATTTTTGNASSTVTFFNIPTGTSLFEARTVGNSNTAPAAGCGFLVYGVVRSDGVTGTLISTQESIHIADASILPQVNAVFAVLGNNIQMTVTGSNDVVGRVIDWNILFTYRTVN